ncbi:hypothetical protein KQX54_007071 [Cotesia glomerata]|uniref:Uncharacterized protein n=1 Tax=Cotesia glomerata TaxID=32391 RepID=A0AAV7HQ21_COTGL|nr:hypothetical protein KQX54_007071 [Cotesia glomerata]
MIMFGLLTDTRINKWVPELTVICLKDRLGESLVSDKSLLKALQRIVAARGEFRRRSSGELVATVVVATRTEQKSIYSDSDSGLADNGGYWEGWRVERPPKATRETHNPRMSSSNVQHLTILWHASRHNIINMKHKQMKCKSIESGIIEFWQVEHTRQFTIDYTTP